MSKTDWSTASPAEIAERCARIQGRRRGYPSRDGSARRVSRDYWWTEARGLVIGVLGEVRGEPVYDPANNEAQAIALFESEHWPVDAHLAPSDANVLIGRSPSDELCPTCMHERETVRWYAMVSRQDHPHPTARAIAEAICVAHETREEKADAV